MQVEGIMCLRRALSTADDDVVGLQTEVQVYNVAIQANVLDNKNLRYTMAVYYRPRPLHYISITHFLVLQYILSHLGHVMDM